MLLGSLRVMWNRLKRSSWSARVSMMYDVLVDELRNTSVNRNHDFGGAVPRSHWIFHSFIGGTYQLLFSRVRYVPIRGITFFRGIFFCTEFNCVRIILVIWKCLPRHGQIFARAFSLLKLWSESLGRRKKSRIHHRIRYYWFLNRFNW